MSCAVCKLPEPVRENQIYQGQGRAESLVLCHFHSQELFLMGQFRFIKKYKSKLGPEFQLVEELKRRPA